jgi:hypothetical protein
MLLPGKLPSDIKESWHEYPSQGVDINPRAWIPTPGMEVQAQDLRTDRACLVLFKVYNLSIYVAIVECCLVYK